MHKRRRRASWRFCAQAIPNPPCCWKLWAMCLPIRPTKPRMFPGSWRLAPICAAYTIGQPGTRGAYITLAEWALVHQLQSQDSFKNPEHASPVLTRLFEELDDANAWQDDLKSKERNLVADSHDPEAEFNRLYAEEPRVPDDTDDASQDAQTRRMYQVGSFVALGLVGLIAVMMVVIRFARALARRDSRT